MERKQRRLQGVMAAIGFLVLIFDSRLALEGARSGLELCIKTVIPALFPFFVLSMVLTNALQGKSSYPVQQLAKTLGIPKAAESILIPSVLGGYPIGAKCVGDLYQREQISRKEAERLLAFSSNAGPSFLFGMVSAFFPERKMIWLLWLIHIFSAALTAAVIPVVKTDKHVLQPEKTNLNTSIILSAAKAMCCVCCWVVLFRIIIRVLEVWFLWMLPEWVQTLLMGILELTNGCCELLQITDVKLRFILCSCMLAFGGICVLFQTASVTQGLSIGCYIKGKLIQTTFSFLMSCAMVSEHGLFIAAWIPILLYILRKYKIGIAIPGFFLYNTKRKIPEALSCCFEKR